MIRNCVLQEHLQRTFYYDRWANNHVFDVMLALRDVSAKDTQRMAHIVAALELWLGRVTGNPHPPADTNPLRPNWSLEEGKKRLGDVHRRWSAILSTLDDDGLRRTIEWERTEGGRYQALLRDIATQLPLHGAYHRGQLSITLKERLQGPLDLDYIFTTWEPAGEPSIA